MACLWTILRAVSIGQMRLLTGNDIYLRVKFKCIFIFEYLMQIPSISKEIRII